MFQNIKTVFKQSFIYGLGTGLMRLTGFVLIPVYARYISPADFGTLAIFLLIIAIMNVIFNMGIGQAFFRFYYDCKSDLEKKQLMGTVIIFLILVNAVFSIIMIAGDEWILKCIFGSSEYTYHLKLIVINVVADNLSSCQLRLYRTKNMPVKFSIFCFLKFVTELVFTIIFVINYERSLLGVLEGRALSSCICYVFIFIAQIKHIRPAFIINKIKGMLNYGSPFIPASLCSFVLMSSDRYLLKIFSGYSEVGLYAMGYKFGVFINVFIITPFGLAWPTQIISISKKENAQEIFAKIMTYFVLITISCNVILVVWIKDIYSLFLTPEYTPSYAIVPFILFSYTFQGMYTVGVLSMFLTKKTKPQFIIAAVAALINFGLNFIFIPKWGMVGAAFTTFISYLTIPIMTYYFGQKLYPVNYEFKRMAKIFIVSLIIVSGSYFSGEIDVLDQLAFKISLMLFFPLFLFLIGFFEKKELSKMRLLLNRVLQRA